MTDLLSVGEYLRVEEASPVKHEYVAGRIFALAGATKRHNQITVNLAARLHAAARGGPCRVYVADVKLRASEEVLYYPDVMVACGPAGDDPLIEDSPCLVIEVTSPSTVMIDRREKALAYRQIAGLQAYVIVHQDEPRVERHWRDQSGAWQYAEVTGGGRVVFSCPELELSLSLDEIYEGAAAVQ